MAALARWDPFRELEEISERFNRIISRPGARSESGQQALAVPDWFPPVDIIEDEKEYLIKVEIPEINRNDVKVRVQEGVLLIQGERKKLLEENGKRFRKIERLYGSFARSFTLPENVAEDKVTAEFKDGMLFVRLPKTEQRKPKSIEVKVQ